MKDLVRRLAEHTTLTCGAAETFINTCKSSGVSVEDLTIVIEDLEAGGNKIDALIAAIELCSLPDPEPLSSIELYAERYEKTPMPPRKYGEMLARKRNKKREKRNTGI